MQDVIRLLPESLANQIAAGEVVQRPASAVKELLENAIDAGSKNITLQIKDAGRTLIKVIDDGFGMSETDARMSFERHATSKVSKSEDLFAISTFGFRGEALASIAAVAQVELQSRREEDELGTFIDIEGSEVQKQETVACSKGTSIAVKNLFFNVPARRKFLKSNPVELKHIIDEFQRVALANPEISMSFYNDDKEVYKLKDGNVAKRIVSIFGKSYQEQLFPCAEDLDIIQIKGYVGKPENAKKTSGEQFFFVNNRFIKHRGLHQAVMSAYERLVPEKSFPFYLIFISIDPTDVDVNVHPTKTEVKFADERTLYALVGAAVKQALASYGVAPSIDFGINVNFAKGREEFTPTQSEEVGKGENPNFFNTVFNQDTKTTFPNNSDTYTTAPSNLNQDPNMDDDMPFVAKVSSRINNWDKENGMPAANMVPDNNSWGNMDTNTSFTDNFPDPHEVTPIIPETQPIQQPITFSSRANELEDIHEDANDAISERSEPIQIRKQYILFQVKSGIMLMDQEAAHERILYEKFLQQMQDHSGMSQKLLFPKAIELHPGDFALFSEFKNEIIALGFSIEIQGKNSVVVNGIPVLIKNANEQDILEGILEQIKYNRSELHLSNVENIARSLAKRTAIRRGHEMGVDEMRSMTEQLFSCSNPNYSPDGRKTIVLQSMNDIEKLFKL